MIHVKVTTNQGLSEFSMPLSATIFQVKQKINESFPNYIVGSEEVLFYNGQVLDDDRSLESYNFRDLVSLNLDVTLQQPKFYILAKSFNKETVMKVKPTTTVSHLKDKIERKWGIFKDDLILAHNHEAMKDDFPLSYYNVHANSIIEVVTQYLSR
ncbi:hypothetical protein P3X46_004049 [Hevea brasiliensis]|uniref:Ubiquitin-like domain-containing protein n=1 Tax=Hevea brasiliensis TaxID=3981 RepID=A0ABQ9MZN0_HEVBR|nr:uncharacterized protein LOC131178797 [Hevea brasiliensis]KAJ9184314.1 hypothetical protein P3X46_004049 [Hevea brasiliensis]